MLPNYGTRIPYMLFEPLVDGIEDQIRDEIISQARYWIPEITIDKVEFSDDLTDLENNRISFTVYFSLKVDSSISDFIQIEATT